MAHFQSRIMRPAFLTLWGALGFLVITCANDAAARTIEFETSQVTDPDVTVSPDGRWIVFTILGHLFRLPILGGDAEQLTFGPYYDTDPVFSPDGKRLAFVSNRDRSHGNIYVLHLERKHKRIEPITHEYWAGRPTWDPKGKAIVYLSYGKEAPFWAPPAAVRRVDLRSHKIQNLTKADEIVRTVFWLPDGRLAGAVMDTKEGNTRLEIIEANGGTSVFRTLEGYVHRVETSPTNDSLICRRHLTGQNFHAPLQDDVLLVPVPAEQEVTTVQVLPANFFPALPRRFAVVGDPPDLYLGESGRLWRMGIAEQTRQVIPFRAKVRMELAKLTAPTKWSAPTRGETAPRAVLSPRLSPDGNTLVFVAFGHIWQQAVGGGPAKRIQDGDALERDPVFSADGQRLAFVHIKGAKNEIRVFDFDSGKTRTVAEGWWQPSWSPDGSQLVFARYDRRAFHVTLVDLSNGAEREVVETGLWSPRPHFSQDGRHLYFTDNNTSPPFPPYPANSAVYRLSLEDPENAEQEALTALKWHVSDAQVSPDGKWIAFRRNTEIWIARQGAKPVQEKQVRRLSEEGGESFSFAPDSKSLIYAVGSRVFTHPIGRGRRRQLTANPRAAPSRAAPLLLQGIRVLDFSRGDFGLETSVFIENGRIQWIGKQEHQEIPPETIILDAKGRFAVPGFFDLHVHIDRFRPGADQGAFLAYGVTSVREVGGSLPWLNTLADRSDTSADPLPRFFYTGNFFEFAEGRAGVGDLSVLLQNENEARAYVRRWKKRGAHGIKAYNTLPWPLRRAIAEESRRQGLFVVVHGRFEEQITRATIDGFWSVEHPTFVPSYSDVHQMLALAGTRWIPTLAVPGNLLLAYDQPARFQEEKIQAFTPPQFLAGGPLAGTVLPFTLLRGHWGEQLSTVLAAHTTGVKVGPGSDAPFQWDLYGSALHFELEHLVAAGLSPLEVIRAATQEAATAVGADDLGTLEPQKVADLVLLEGNPLEDIRNTHRVWRVIKGGRLFDPEALKPKPDVPP